MFSSSFLLPPLSPQPPSGSDVPQTTRQDSFIRLASELEQIAAGDRSQKASPTHAYGHHHQHQGDVIMNQDDVFRAFSGMAPELSGLPTGATVAATGPQSSF